ncbi:hypothetical protein C3B59_03870 [Cryobacterium zongtaii]|uniref:Amidase domain-containing protein n=1 Tax=Cryobacterium zongtaii TaxID=1259217 RepID=A0A2S3ZP98_9MICO|nr:amidase family protein [Cryobacterium zongtaii]POH70815.1 hypothetical protein C3B59_03870 [Cryobacterium zongtaii]
MYSFERRACEPKPETPPEHSPGLPSCRRSGAHPYGHAYDSGWERSHHQAALAPWPTRIESPSVFTFVWRTLNPWHAAHTAGGSPGGSAAAMAAGLSWGDLGSDLSGSIRVPASWCGVFGHRPNAVGQPQGGWAGPITALTSIPIAGAHIPARFWSQPGPKQVEDRRSLSGGSRGARLPPHPPSPDHRARH